MNTRFWTDASSAGLLLLALTSCQPLFAGPRMPCLKAAASKNGNFLVIVERQQGSGRNLWVHRKGAMSARLGEHGVLPGSMGSLSFHVEGRGCEDALCSSAHGAGRVLSRTAARRQVTERALRQQMEGSWYDSRKTDGLRDEAPSAYKDIRAVLRAQKEMVKVTRALRPVLNYKGL